MTLEEALRGSTRKVTLRRPGSDGENERTDTYQVRIPAGVREGQRIRLAGQGGAGFGGGHAGDLYLRVRLARHPDLSVQGADLYCDLELAPWEAVLGVQAKIPALDGTTSLRVPAGTLSGSQLRLRGLGLPREDGTPGRSLCGDPGPGAGFRHRRGAQRLGATRPGVEVQTDENAMSKALPSKRRSLTVLRLTPQRPRDLFARGRREVSAGVHPGPGPALLGSRDSSAHGRAAGSKPQFDDDALYEFEGG